MAHLTSPGTYVKGVAKGGLIALVMGIILVGCACAGCMSLLARTLF